MNESTNQTTIENQSNTDIIAMFKTLWNRRKVFYWLWPITFVLSSALILCVPRYYTCEVILAPEAQSSGPSGSLQALASSFGFNMQTVGNVDAYYPTLYPSIVESPDFLIKLFDTKVATSDGEYEGTYYDYMRTKHKFVFWKRWKNKILGLLAPKEPAPIVKGSSVDKGVNVFCLSKTQKGVIGLMADNIVCSVDKKTDVITISVTAQDKLVCATMADSVCVALQKFITDYRTVKNRIDLKYYEEIMNDAYCEYQQASDEYVRFVDSHSGMNLERYRIEAQNLETEMELKRSAYTSFQKQHFATQARLQENTPVFTIMQSASIPLRPSGPKRMFFVLAMLVVATFVAFCIVCKDQIIALMATTEQD